MALSKKQNKRLGSILSVMFNETVPLSVVENLKTEGYLDDKCELTDKGLDEKNRLCTLAGLNINYSSEKK